MRTNFQKVEDFTAHFGLPARPMSDPGLLDDKTFLFRHQFLSEELLELMDAHRKGDLASFADALGDLIYVAYGTAKMSGIDLDAVFAEIHRANMQKVRATNEDNRRGSKIDVIKPEGWMPPNIDDVLERQVESQCKKVGVL